MEYNALYHPLLLSHELSKGRPFYEELIQNRRTNFRNLWMFSEFRRLQELDPANMNWMNKLQKRKEGLNSFAFLSHLVQLLVWVGLWNNKQKREYSFQGQEELWEGFKCGMSQIFYPATHEFIFNNNIKVKFKKSTN